MSNNQRFEHSGHLTSNGRSGLLDSRGTWSAWLSVAIAALLAALACRLMFPGSWKLPLAAFSAAFCLGAVLVLTLRGKTLTQTSENAAPAASGGNERDRQDKVEDQPVNDDPAQMAAFASHASRSPVAGNEAAEIEIRIKLIEEQLSGIKSILRDAFASTVIRAPLASANATMAQTDHIEPNADEPMMREERAKDHALHQPPLERKPLDEPLKQPQPLRATAGSAAKPNAPIHTEQHDHTVETVAQSLAVIGRARIAVLSPEDDASSIGSVLLARALAGLGAGTVLIDMTGKGISSNAMLSGKAMPGIRNLLAGDANFSDVIHGDEGSVANIIPLGTSTQAKGRLIADKLQMILAALDNAYEYVIVDCGSTEAAGLSKVTTEQTVTVISARDVTADEVDQIADAMMENDLTAPLLMKIRD